MQKMIGKSVTSHQVSTLFRGVAALLFVWLLSLQAAMAKDLPDFTVLVEKNSDAVVNISTTQQRPPAHAGGLPFSDRQLDQLPEFFQDFFSGPQSPFGRRGPQQSEPVRSMGSGFIVSADGYVLTNHHVIEGADEIVVRLSDRRELAATVVGTDSRSDLAVLKIENSEDLPVVKIGRSDKLRAGQWVFAIGSPFGFDHTVTAGIVSAVGRSLPTENYVPFIQTDVAINPGNSGGPLFNLDGEVVGINSQIYTRSGGFMGVSFAIPIDDVMNVFRQIRDDGSVARGWLGVLIQEVSRDLAESFGLKRPRGALVAEVLAGSPAQKAGLRSGDIILDYDDEEINLSSDLPPKVGRTPIDEAATLTILRDGERMKLDVVIGRLPEDDGAQASTGQPAPPASTPLGLKVEALTAELKDAFDLEGGVVVTGVATGPALSAGIRPNDVITELNRQSIESVSQFYDVVASLPKGKAIPVRVVRQGQATYLVMKP